MARTIFQKEPDGGGCYSDSSESTPEREGSEDTDMKSPWSISEFAKSVGVEPPETVWTFLNVDSAGKRIPCANLDDLTRIRLSQASVRAIIDANVPTRHFAFLSVAYCDHPEERLKAYFICLSDALARYCDVDVDQKSLYYLAIFPCKGVLALYVPNLLWRCLQDLRDFNQWWEEDVFGCASTPKHPLHLQNLALVSYTPTGQWDSREFHVMREMYTTNVLPVNIRPALGTRALPLLVMRERPHFPPIAFCLPQSAILEEGDRKSIVCLCKPLTIPKCTPMGDGPQYEDPSELCERAEVEQLRTSLIASLWTNSGLLIPGAIIPIVRTQPPPSDLWRHSDLIAVRHRELSGIVETEDEDMPVLPSFRRLSAIAAALARGNPDGKITPSFVLERLMTPSTIDLTSPSIMDDGKLLAPATGDDTEHERKVEKAPAHIRSQVDEFLLYLCQHDVKFWSTEAAKKWTPISQVYARFVAHVPPPRFTSTAFLQRWRSLFNLESKRMGKKRHVHIAVPTILLAMRVLMKNE